MYKRVGNPKIDQELLRTRSPLFAANKIEVPLFVAQGYNDPRVNHAEAEQIVQALKANEQARRVPAEDGRRPWLREPGESAGFL